ncbi:MULTISPECIES: ABC transporter permease [unclassified Bacillus cereus group]|uniref:ABC transporter permease n=1 Tax=unclassified Bacillus cereus group TaxID=2750818 RepID=UPI001F58AC1E|nr:MULTISPECIES: ABC transporter permease [unclassified Bacillus cereus group]
MFLKRLKMSSFLIILFSGISFFLSISVSSIQSIFIQNNQNNDFVTSESVKFSIKQEEGILSNNMDLSFLKELSDDFLLYKEYPVSDSKAIIFKGKKQPNPPIFKGRYFNEQDIKDNKKVAVIGKNILKEAIRENNNIYIFHENEKFLVIGILGYKDKNSMWDNYYYVNLSSLIKNTSTFFIEGTYILDAENQTNEVFENLKKKIESSGHIQLTRIDDSRFESPITLLLNDQRLNILVICVVLLALILNTVSITSHWINYKKQEIAVRKTVGGTNWQIGRKILLEYELLVLYSFFIGFLLYVVVVKGQIITFMDYDLYPLSTFLTLIFCMFIGFITAAIPISKMFKMEVKEILR